MANNQHMNHEAMDCGSGAYDLRDVLRKLIQKPMTPGEHWYLLDIKWWQLCRLYLKDTERQLVRNPGPIDNSALFESTNSWTLRNGLKEDIDYQFVPEEGWHLLVAEFGLLGAEHVISRPVIHRSRHSAYAMHEVYPLVLHVRPYGSTGDDNEIIVDDLSRATTLAQLTARLKTLMVVEVTAETRLWSNGCPLNASPTDDDQSLYDAGITKKSVVELEVRNRDGTWPSSASYRPTAAVPGVCGLINLGHTCFMNAALQCLSHTQPLTEYLLSGDYKRDLNRENPLGMGGQIADAYAALIGQLWSGCHTCVAATDFRMIVSIFAEQFQEFAEQDSQELMAFLLDGLNHDLNRVRHKSYVESREDTDDLTDQVLAEEQWLDYRRLHDSIIVDTFHGQLKSTIQCSHCQYMSRRFDPYCYLSLPLPEKRERRIDVTFVSTLPSMRSQTVGSEQMKVIQITGLCVPIDGVIADICKSVTTAVNECHAVDHTVHSESLLVTDVYNHRFYKIFDRHESYETRLTKCDELVVYELQDANCPSVAVYMREVNADKTTGALFGRPFVVSITSDSDYKSVYQSVIQHLLAFIPEGLDESTGSFGLALVNSFGSLDIKPLDPSNAFSSKNSLNYLAVDLPSNVRTLYNKSKARDVIKLPVPTPNEAETRVSLDQCMALFTAAEHLSGDNLWSCPKCRCHRSAVKKFDIWSLPDVLIIQLMRFSYRGGYREKLDVPIDYPIRSLDMSQYMTHNDGSNIYDLIAVSDHFSERLETGCYTAYARDYRTGSWHHYKDRKVSEASEQDVVSGSAYVLFYKRR